MSGGDKRKKLEEDLPRAIGSQIELACNMPYSYQDGLRCWR